MPSAFAKCAVLSRRWFPSDSMISSAAPEASRMMFFSIRLPFDGWPTVPVRVTSMVTPLPFSDRSLDTTVLLFEPSNSTAAPLEPKIVLPSRRLPCDRSRTTPPEVFTLISFSRINVSFVWNASQMPMAFAEMSLKRMMLPSTFESNDDGGGDGSGWSMSVGCGTWPSPMPASWPCWMSRCSTMFFSVPGFNMTPQSNSTSLPFLIVTLSWPSLRIPAATPLPSIVWPSRSMVMLGAPTTSPSQRQSARSFLTLMLVLTTWPQKMKPGAGSEPTYHVNLAGDGSSLPVMSVALTWNSRAPVGRPVYVFGELHGSNSV